METIMFFAAAIVSFVLVNWLLPTPRYSGFDSSPKRSLVKDNVVHVDFKQKRRVA